MEDGIRLVLTYRRHCVIDESNTRRSESFMHSGPERGSGSWCRRSISVLSPRTIERDRLERGI